MIQPIIKDLITENIFSMIVFVLEDNPSIGFYESLGGKKNDTVETTIGRKALHELVYGWEDIKKMPFQIENNISG